MTLRLTSMLAILAVGAPAHAVDETDTVTIRDFTLTPMGHLTYRDNRLLIHPKAMIGAGYNSNIEASSSDQVSDAYGEAVAGIEARYLIGDSQQVTLDVEGEGRGYHEQSERDLVGGRARGRYEIEDSHGMSYRALGGYARYDDPLVESGEQITRGTGSLGALAEWRGLRTRISVSGDWQNENFFESGSRFGEDERDNDILRVSLAAGQSPAEGAELFVRVVGDSQDFVEGESRYQDSTGIAGLVGWRGLVATRITLLAEAGIERRTYAGAFANDPAYDDEVTTPIGSAVLRWTWEAGSHIGARAYRSVISSISANAATLTGLDGDVRYRLREKAALIAGGKVYLIEQSGAASGELSEERGTGQVWAGAEYFIRDGVGVRLVGRYEASESRTANDYERLSALVSLGFAY